jgi:1-acyl-sn-glycerol-3-phosphate acyltransferase
MLDQLLRATPPPVEGTLRTFGAAGGDMVKALDVFGLLNGERAEDPFDRRDPEYIERTLPALKMMSDLYFRGDVRDLQRIPKDEPVLLVGNHSGGTLIADTFVFSQAFYDYFGSDRLFHQLAHDLVFKLPGARAIMEPWGTVPASPDNMARALDKGAALLVYPGGDHETYRPSWESDVIDMAGRTGFVKLALKHGTPIVPVVSVGGQETALFLGQGRDLAKLLQFDKLLRIKVFPAQLGPPFGVTFMDLPGRIPLPAKITIQVLPRIDLKKELGPKPALEDAYDLVTERMQDALDDLAAERLLPVVG